jgi:hypothetical protein
MQVAAHVSQVLPPHSLLQQSWIRGMLHPPGDPKWDDVQAGELTWLLCVRIAAPQAGGVGSRQCRKPCVGHNYDDYDP